MTGDDLASLVGCRVILSIAAGAEFRGVLQAVTRGGAAVLLCDGVKLDGVWTWHRKLRMVAGVVEAVEWGEV